MVRRTLPSFGFKVSSASVSRDIGEIFTYFPKNASSHKTMSVRDKKTQDHKML